MILFKVNFKLTSKFSDNRVNIFDLALFGINLFTLNVNNRLNQKTCFNYVCI